MQTNFNPLWIVIDTSGSMKEMGKLMICRNLISFVNERMNIKQANLIFNQIILISVSETSIVINHNWDQELPTLKAGGKLNISNLLELLDSELIDFKAEARLLFLTDGAISHKEKEQFIAWRNMRSNLSVRTVAIGQDANIRILKVLSNENMTFLPENIACAIDPWYMQSKAKQILPGSLNEIKFSATSGENLI